MRPRRKLDGTTKAELQMTSMIDIVFLLLIFFITTFKIGAQEGDFNVKMPLSNSGSQNLSVDLPIKLRLKADSEGNLSEIVVNDGMSFGKDFAKLRAFIMQTVGDKPVAGDDSGPEIEIDLDYNLRYSNVVESITAVTGRRQGRDIIRLVDKIKFAPPRRPNP